MGSIVMHLCASNEANKILKYDSNRFLIGSIAPDIHKITTGSPVDSHYLKKVYINGKKNELPDLDRFLNENKDKIISDDFYKGYFAHLIADDIWYRYEDDKMIDEISEDGNQIKLIGNADFIPFEKYRKAIYDDYSNINSFLIEKYNIDVNYLYNVSVLNIDNASLQKLIKNNTSGNNIKNIEDIKLNILNINDVLQWIENSKDEIIYRLTNIK